MIISDVVVSRCHRVPSIVWIHLLHKSMLLMVAKVLGVPHQGQSGLERKPGKVPPRQTSVHVTGYQIQLFLWIVSTEDAGYWKRVSSHNCCWSLDLFFCVGRIRRTDSLFFAVVRHEDRHENNNYGLSIDSLYIQEESQWNKYSRHISIRPANSTSQWKLFQTCGCCFKFEKNKYLSPAPYSPILRSVSARYRPLLAERGGNRPAPFGLQLARLLHGVSGYNGKNVVLSAFKSILSGLIQWSYF